MFDLQRGGHGVDIISLLYDIRGHKTLGTARCFQKRRLFCKDWQQGRTNRVYMFLRHFWFSFALFP